MKSGGTGSYVRRRTEIQRTRAAAGLAIMVMLGALAGCTATQQATAPPPPTTAMLTYPASGPTGPAGIVISVTDLQGSWGLASYRKPEDRARTETEAKNACSNPYSVAAGPTGGAMMYLADQAQPSEVFIKTGPGGQTFIGPQGQAGVAQDRVVLEYANNVLVADWMDASARERYGTMIFVRCGVA